LRCSGPQVRSAVKNEPAIVGYSWKEVRLLRPVAALPNRESFRQLNVSASCDIVRTQDWSDGAAGRHCRALLDLRCRFVHYDTTIRAEAEIERLGQAQCLDLAIAPETLCGNDRAVVGHRLPAIAKHRASYVSQVSSRLEII
jgi:hypothetical protein